MRYRATQDCFYGQTYVEAGTVVEIPKGAPVYDYFEPVRAGASGRDAKGAESEGDDAGQTARDLLNDQLGAQGPKPWDEKKD